MTPLSLDLALAVLPPLPVFLGQERKYWFWNNITPLAVARTHIAATVMNGMSFPSIFADDMIYHQSSEASYSIESAGKENVKSYYETHFNQIEHQVNGERTRGNISRLTVDDSYLKVWVDIIYTFADAPSIVLTCEEEFWLNQVEKIIEIVLSISSTQLQELGDHL